MFTVSKKNKKQQQDKNKQKQTNKQTKTLEQRVNYIQSEQ